MPIIASPCLGIALRRATCLGAALLTGCVLSLSRPAPARTLTVGPDQAIKLPSDAARVVADGDRIEIEAGTYNDCAVWRASGLTIEGLGAGAVLAGKSCEGKGIFVIAGNDTTVRNLSFERARVSDGNGAGIRQEGRNLTVEGSTFTDNENGILTGASPDSTVIIRNSVFAGNGVCNPDCSHGLYAGHIKLLRIEKSKFIGTKEGHHVKSRAINTEIYDSEFQDGAKGTASFAVDVPNGGAVIMKNNSVEKGPLSENNTAAVSIGEEGNLQPTPYLIFEGNRFTNDMPNRTFFVRNLTRTPALLDKNTYIGAVSPLSGEGIVKDRAALLLLYDRLVQRLQTLKAALGQRLKDAAKL